MIRNFLSFVALGVLMAGCSGTGDNASTSETALAPGEKSGEEANPDRNVYFGDLHIHTKNSFDAYIFNVRATPDDAYKFGMGETIKHPLGYDLKLEGPPLDFMAVTDHASYLGHLETMNTPGTVLSKLDMAKDMFSTDQEKILTAFQLIGGAVRDGVKMPGVYDPKIVGNVWKQIKDSADKYNKPGKFTTFSGYEYTAVRTTRGPEGGFAGGNLHRNVVFKGSAPDMPFATVDSVNPEDLWNWMDSQRDAGNDVMAIPHNSNVSDGEMFKMETYNGQPLTKAYAEKRLRNEPIVEITQVKGTSETHPSLSPNDEWADFEIYEYLLSSQTKSKTATGDYVRQALVNGLALTEKIGANPFQFGFIGSSDTHVAGGSFDEKNFWSKIGAVDGTPELRGSVPPGDKKSWEGVTVDPRAANWFSRWSASGYAAVWAEQNTREAIFDAMRRKETYATTGTRIKLRFFGGFGFDEKMLDDPAMVSKAYKNGVPMGGDLVGAGKAPGFIVWAMRDAASAPLQRVQIVKVWTDGGKANEKIFDVACSDGGTVDANFRCPDNGAKVDLSDCSISQDKGAPELKTFWRDPEHKNGQRASYYVRVLENPVCRWSTWDALRAGVPPNPALQKTIQERAWSSPIWYVPTTA
ncbi:DUF3604 domain-containing protein [Parasphingorhabdus halotolerans]|uniref:DUF3604 domain-containing protein n=1 Tax=Parasphingorhabdus halotolerans TaxID=2725558 RepID=A0A6H2DMV6_9SPHN|nr:DUF3604 domain-containing protein [Parasphingorhabdus halotolerans]QJB69999.1 DUF3604 domain-containing protein [Parasphingorhabdus halotolerans]